MRPFIALTLCAALSDAHAWGADGHQTVATLAEKLIEGSPAAAQVAALLDGLTLAQAAVWADCAKGVDPQQGYKYRINPRFAECRPLETPAGIAEMEDFVRRNDVNCPRSPGDESCHKQYHYTDTAIQRAKYKRGDHGTRDDDIVGAIQAATLVLQGKPAPAPFRIKGPREALLLLTHYVGDIHQPLHVGSVYLSEKGRRLDPKKAAVSASNDTRGGNSLFIVGKQTPSFAAPMEDTDGAGFLPGPIRMHAIWDGVAGSMEFNDVDTDWLAGAKGVRRSRGAPTDWPVAWASGSLRQASEAFKGLRFSAKDDGHWTTQLPSGYSSRASAIKRQQLTLAGARLAHLLTVIFP